MKKAFDKYWYYHRSVQSPDLDVRFMRACYRNLKKKEPYIFREDFCSTFSLSCSWVQMGPRYRSIAVDIDDRPLKYGRKNYLKKMLAHQQKRVQIIHSNVLNQNITKADIVSASNFSYFALKKRSELKRYFSNSLKSIKPGGIFVLDCFGGSECLEESEEEVDHGDFSYFWDQSSFDPISHDSLFYIHFKRKGEKKRERVFRYDWRLWTIPEIKDLLEEVGFRKIHVYWEGTDKKGEGNGRFTRRKRGEDCESWIAYIVSEK